MPELRWLETHLESMEEARNLIEEFRWKLGIHKSKDGKWYVTSGPEEIIFVGDTKGELDSFLYGMALAYNGIPSPYFERVVSEVQQWFRESTGEEAITSKRLELIYHAIQRYNKRLLLVKQAVNDLSPVMLSGFDLTTATIDEIFKYYEQIDLVPERGIWRDGEQVEWKYHFHGNACRLIHPITGEPIDWEMPEIDIFEKWFFFRWFEWLLSVDSHLKKEFANRDHRDLIDEALNLLKTRGLVASKDGKLYKLIEE